MLFIVSADDFHKRKYVAVAELAKLVLDIECHLQFQLMISKKGNMLQWLNLLNLF